MKALLTLCALAAALTACGDDDDDGIQVAVKIAEQTLPSEVTTNQGTASLTASYVVIEATELVACQTAASRLWRFINPLPSAFAHSESSPLLLGTPVVVRLDGQRAELDVGTLAPPAGQYCGVRLHIGAADDDALGLADDVAMVGKTLSVNGSVGSEAFHIESDGEEELLATLDATTFSAKDEHHTITVTVKTDDLLDNVDVFGASAAAATLDNIASAFTVALE